MATKLFSDFILDHFSYDPVSGLITNNKTGKVYTKNQPTGYITFSVPNKHTGEFKKVYAHRLAWYLYYGVEPDIIDHMNGIRDDNRINNLQSVTKKANEQNNKSRSSFPGASKNGQNYKAQGKQDNKLVFLGTYASQYEAHLVATYYRAKHFSNYMGNDLALVPLPVGVMKHPYHSNTLLHEILKIKTTKGVQAINYFK